MPKLLVQKNAKTASTRYSPPHSLFQRMIDQARRRKNISERALARKVSALPDATVSQATFWEWVHCSKGYPATRSFKPAHLVALAAVLEIPEKELAAALDVSRAIYTDPATPTPRPQIDAFDTLEQTLKAMSQTYVKRKTILHLVQALRAGANASQ